jgi:hypothetical protein
MAVTWEASQEAFAQAAQWFVRVAARVGDDRWEAPGLGEWDVRALVGHTSRSLLTVEAYLGQPAERVEVASAAEYVRVTREIAAGPGVAQRGRDAGAALGDEPAGAVAEIAARVVPVVRACDGTELVTTIAGGMRLADYLPTRTFELVVHTADLVTAIGLPTEAPADRPGGLPGGAPSDAPGVVPPAAARQALDLVAELAVADGRAVPLLLAATGRAALPAGFSVL